MAKDIILGANAALDGVSQYLKLDSVGLPNIEETVEVWRGAGMRFDQEIGLGGGVSDGFICNGGAVTSICNGRNDH